jgi:hypothetical protein
MVVVAVVHDSPSLLSFTEVVGARLENNSLLYSPICFVHCPA